MTFGRDRKSINKNPDVLSSFLASTCALTIGVNLSWTPPPAGHGAGPSRAAPDAKAVMYLVAINWAQCAGAVVHAAVRPRRLLAYGVCVSFAAAILSSIADATVDPYRSAVCAYVVAALQGLGCGSLAVAVPNYIVTYDNGRTPYRSAALCLIEAFTLAGTLISRASGVLMTRQRAGFVMAGAVFVNLLSLVLIGCARRRPTAIAAEHYCDSRTEPGRPPTSGPDVGLTQKTAATTLDTIRCLFAEREHRNSVFSSLALFVFRDFSAVHVFEKCIRRMFNELNTNCVSHDQFDLLVAALQLIFTVVTVFAVEVYGKKRLVLISSLGMLMSSVGVELIVRNADSVDAGAARSACLMAAMLLYVVFFAHGLSSIPWAVQFDAIHPEVRSFATGTIISVHFLCSMIAEFSTVDDRAVHARRSTVPFWIMSVCLAQVVFVEHCVRPDQHESVRPPAASRSNDGL